jgi:hypothetical protein
VTKKYQKTTIETSALAVPEQVSVAMSEIAEEMGEGLLALAVGAGLQVMAQLMEADVSAVCGPRGKHNPRDDVPSAECCVRPATRTRSSTIHRRLRARKAQSWV